ncbi:MAG: hypothetical protein Q4A49_03640 [Neisseria sp.]|nr:hypothetical protein [Neisseria sp.]
MFVTQAHDCSTGRRHGLRLGVSKTWGQRLETTLQASLRRSGYRAEHAWL